MTGEGKYPVYLKGPDGEPVRVGWAGPPAEEGGLREVQIDFNGPGRDVFNWVSQGPAQGFTYGEEPVDGTS